MSEVLRATALTIDVPGRTLLSKIDLTLLAGEVISIMGPSGSGKSSLLTCIAGITRPAAGSIDICGESLFTLSSSKRALLRRRAIGMVFQFGELIAELSAIENVSLPLRLAGSSRASAEESAIGLLERVGLSGRLRALPHQLSGGEIQRVALCRAAVHEPSLVLADEPTGALDETNARSMVELLVSMSRELGLALILATHDPLMAQYSDRIYQISNESLVSIPTTGLPRL